MMNNPRFVTFFAAMLNYRFPSLALLRLDGFVGNYSKEAAPFKKSKPPE